VGRQAEIDIAAARRAQPSEVAEATGGAGTPAGSPAIIGALPPGWDLPRSGRLALGPVPAHWSLDRVVRSHGWCGLPPNAYDTACRRFHRTLDLPDAGPLTVTVTANGTVSWGRVTGTKADRAAIRSTLRRMLCVDDDVHDLYAACEKVPWLAWVPAVGGGRLLRSPTVWEDLARMLATTNCSWALTRSMLTKLVESLGAVGPAGERAFPTREAVATAGADHLREVVRAGYRGPSFVALATTPEPIETWLDPSLTDEEVQAGLLRLRGFGPYAAQGMLGLLGRPRGLAIDSWVRAKLPTLLAVPSLTDADIAARYATLGQWAGWGLWLELTKDWFNPADGRSQSPDPGRSARSTKLA
jgi:3-methyladenine DNA glycosylase/8-oxoguanine DNA glycosylase